ncbi:MAG: alpha/beta hydrolase family protein, partial [Vicinamibacteria bacterium]
EGDANHLKVPGVPDVPKVPGVPGVPKVLLRPRLGGGDGDPYEVVTRDPSVTAVLRGRAWRDAAPLREGGPYPLVILSHGYPGNRFLMSHLGENLASKGYLVVAIDHAESTYDDLQGFAGTLYHRPYDQMFVLDEIDRMSRAGEGSVLGGLVDAWRAALIGYSMGGYGVVNVVGGGYSQASPTFRNAPPNRLLAPRTAGHPDYPAAADPRIRAAVAIAPWGMPAGFWDAEGLAGIRTPILFVSGSADTVSGYERGTRAMFEAAVNADRALLTYLQANHNAGAPIPPPEESYAFSKTLNGYAFTHYADPVWDNVRMNNILAHFVTAHLDVHVKGDESRRAYLDLVPRGADARWAMDEDGRPGATHTYWRGFARGTAVGLMFERASARATPD